MTYDLTNYVIVEEEPTFNLSVKLVTPFGCGMHCPFCFNNLNKNTKMKSKSMFEFNFIRSIRYIKLLVGGKRSMSLDITGGEPTRNHFAYSLMLEKLLDEKMDFSKIVLTTNGENLWMPSLIKQTSDVCDIVNISVHHYDYNERCRAFGMKGFFNDDYYKDIVRKLTDNGVDVHCSAVLYKKLDESFLDYVNSFVSWCRDIGFVGLRIRSNFYKNDDFFTEYLQDKNFNENIVRMAGLTSKTIDVNGFKVTMLKGVTTLIPYVVGVEAVIDDDGYTYLDYEKKYPLIEEYIKHVYVNKNNHHGIEDRNGASSRSKIQSV